MEWNLESQGHAGRCPAFTISTASACGAVSTACVKRQFSPTAWSRVLALFEAFAFPPESLDKSQVTGPCSACGRHAGEPAGGAGGLGTPCREDFLSA
jgi:hypothetical protein